MAVEATEGVAEAEADQEEAEGEVVEVGHTSTVLVPSLRRGCRSRVHR